MKVIFPFLILALIGLVLRLGFSSQSMRLTEVESGPNLTLLISGEELGYLEPCGCAEGQLGGFARRDSVIQLKICRRIWNVSRLGRKGPMWGARAARGATPKLMQSGRKANTLTLIKRWPRTDTPRIQNV